MKFSILRDRILELFTKNWKVKLGSFFLATVFYVNLQNSKILIKSINVPIDYPKLESGFYYSKTPDKTFPIRIEGLREVVNYYSQFMKAHPDFSNLSAGENQVKIKNISGVPNGIKVTKLKKDITVELEGSDTKTLNVDVNFDGEVPENFEKVSYRVKPNRITISGRKSDVNRVSKIVLPTISLQGAKESFVRKIRIPDLPKGVYPTGGVRQVTVSVTISPQGSQSGEQVISGIPVRCMGSNPYLEPELSEEQVSLRIDSKVPVKSSIIIKGIQATIPCNYSYDPQKKRIIPNNKPASSKVRISRSKELQNIEILQIIPERITVTYKVKTKQEEPKEEEENPTQPEEETVPLPPPPENVDPEAKP